MKIDLKKFFNKKSDASGISIPIENELHGVKIRKLPNGQYIKALNTVQNLPQLIIKGCFPGQELDEIVTFFTDPNNINTDNILAIAGKLLTVVPEQFLKLVSVLLDIPIEKLTDGLTPNETLEILKAYWEVNDMSPFFENLKKIMMGNNLMKNLMSGQSEINNLTTNIGSRTGSISHKNLESRKKNF